jgi:hypothetical protein
MVPAPGLRADDTATAGSGYEAASGTLIFGIGETTTTVTVQVYGDRISESTEHFWGSLSNATNAIIAGSWGRATILDDEPRISITGGQVNEGDSGVTYLHFTVSLSAATDSEVTVRYTTLSGTATVAGGDYEAQSGTLVFAPGETSKLMYPTRLTAPRNSSSPPRRALAA